MKNIISRLLNFLAKFVKVKDNKLLFQSGRSKVDCNPYAVYKYIKENCPTDFECTWLVEKDADVSMLSKGDYVYYKTIKGFFAMTSAKYWIRSQSLGSIIRKKANQVYIQMWHGAGNFKKCAYDSLPEDKRPTETIEHAKEWDYLIATDEFNKECLTSSVCYKKNSVVIGNCETDLLVNANQEYIDNVKSKIKLDNKKVIMYAPTFRDTDLNKTKEELEIPIMKLGEFTDYTVLLRLHPLVSKKVEDIPLPSNFINVGWYPNILDLYLITDILISDYSSIIFPYMLLEKSLIMYPYDYDKYVEVRGGFYLDYHKDLPGKIVYTEEELVDAIKNIDKLNIEYKDKVKEFNEKYNKLNDGKVCERFVNMLKNKEFK